ncbi:MAG: site-specific integrase [Cyanobacteria bacterium J06650_10]
MPKSNRNGQAEIWGNQLDEVMSDLSPKMQVIFSICRYSGCRISEARQLKTSDLVGNCIVFRKVTTKGKATRQVTIHPELSAVLDAADLPESGYLFPGRSGMRPITRQACDKALRKVCDRINLEGHSTHSFRRTTLTSLSNRKVPLRVIQEISGHKSLQELQRYLEVSPQQVEDAITSL